MSFKHRKKGFSLLEVMIASGILALGFMLIVAMWPAAIKLTAVSTERTIGVIAADEGEAMMPLLGLVRNGETIEDAYLRYTDALTANKYALPGGVSAVAELNYVDFADVSGLNWDPLAENADGSDVWDFSDLAYPSCPAPDDLKHYYWSAICKYNDTNATFSVADRLFDAVVFACRVGIENKVYPYQAFDGSWLTSPYPRPVRMQVEYILDQATATFVTKFAPATSYGYLTEGMTVVDDLTGRTMTISKIDRSVDPVQAVISRDFVPDPSLALDNRCIWFIPPSTAAVAGAATAPVPTGKSPCIGVYQKSMLQF